MRHRRRMHVDTARDRVFHAPMYLQTPGVSSSAFRRGRTRVMGLHATTGLAIQTNSCWRFNRFIAQRECCDKFPQSVTDSHNWINCGTSSTPTGSMVPSSILTAYFLRLPNRRLPKYFQHCESWCWRWLQMASLFLSNLSMSQTNAGC